MSTLITTNLKNPSSSTENIVLDASGNISLQAGTAAAPALQPTGDTNTGILFPAADEVAISTGGTQRAVIDSSGRLLVGTSTSPSSGANYALAAIQGNTNSSAGSAEVNLQRGEAATAITSGEVIGTINFTDNAGNIFALLQTAADASAGSGDYPGRLVFSTTADGASSPTERMRISSGGETNLYSSGYALAARVSAGAGTSTAIYYGVYGATTTFNGTVSYQVLSNGNVENTNNSYGAYSDIKLKENIVDSGSQWNDVKSLQVRKYNLKEGQTHTQIGLIAQEVELVSPGLVYETPDRDKDGNETGEVTKGINYSVLYMKAVKALQEAMERIEVLEQRLADAGIT